MKNQFDRTGIVNETDVLVLGAGAAGCMAAIGAREEGAKVTIVEKGAIDSSGCCGGGQDHFQAHLNTGPDWDTDEAATKYYRGPGWGVSEYLAKKTFTKVIGDMVRRMENIGIEFKKNDDGSYYRTQALGQPGPWFLLMTNGVYIKRILAEVVRGSGANVVNQVMVTRLLTKDGRICGALGFNRRNGDFHIFKAKRVVMCMGSHQTRVWSNNSTRNPFNAWQYPYNNGTQITIAADAGAKVVSFEKCVLTTLPKGYGAPGMNAITGMGGCLVNIHGEVFMEKYHPQGEKAARPYHIIAQQEEMARGNGPPFYADMTRMSKENLDLLLQHYLPVDKNSYAEYLEQRGVDIRTEPLEVEFGEYSGAGNLLLNNNCESVTVPGLFGLPFSGMLSTALTGGLVVGQEAAKSVLKSANEKIPEFEMSIIENEKERVYHPLNVREGYTPKEFEDMIREIMNYYMGYNRNQKGLETALAKLQLLEQHMGEIKATNPHELTRANEAMHLLPYGQMMVVAVIKRGGFKGFYRRIDVEIDQELRLKHVSIWRENGEIKSSYDSIGPEK